MSLDKREYTAIVAGSAFTGLVVLGALTYTLLHNKSRDSVSDVEPPPVRTAVPDIVSESYCLFDLQPFKGEWEAEAYTVHLLSREDVTDVWPYQPYPWYIGMRDNNSKISCGFFPEVHGDGWRLAYCAKSPPDPGEPWSGKTLEMEPTLLYLRAVGGAVHVVVVADERIEINAANWLLWTVRKQHAEEEKRKASDGEAGVVTGNGYSSSRF